MQHRQAHRAEQHPAQPATATGAHYQQLGSRRGVQQRAARRPLRDLAAHYHLGVVGLALGKRLLEVRLQQAAATQDARRIGQGADR